MPTFLLLTITFVVWLQFELRKRARQTAEDERFWNREQEANSVRKRDISELEYVKIPLENLPFGACSESSSLEMRGGDENSSDSEASDSTSPEIQGGDDSEPPISREMLAEINACEKEVRALSERNVLRLTGMSNTDIKFAYGAANLPALSQADENYSRLIRALNKWGRLLTGARLHAPAKSVLEYAVSIRGDIEETYYLLADGYRRDGDPAALERLILSASKNFDDLRREKVIARLRNQADAEA